MVPDCIASARLGRAPCEVGYGYWAPSTFGLASSASRPPPSNTSTQAQTQLRPSSPPPTLEILPVTAWSPAAPGTPRIRPDRPAPSPPPARRNATRGQREPAPAGSAATAPSEALPSPPPESRDDLGPAVLTYSLAEWSPLAGSVQEGPPHVPQRCDSWDCGYVQGPLPTAGVALPDCFEARELDPSCGGAADPCSMVTPADQ
eukprot:jgi/Tetstr1/460124/TSEL_005440.t1